MLDFIHLWEVGTKSPWIQKLRYFCPYSAGARTHSASQFAEGQTDNRYCSIHHWKCLQRPHESQNWTMEQQKEREEVWGNVLLGNLVSEFLLMVLCVKSKLLITISLSLRLLSVCAKEEKKRWHESAHYPVYCRGTFCNFTRFTSLHYPHSNIRCLSGLRADVWQAVSSSCFVISLLNVG